MYFLFLIPQNPPKINGTAIKIEYKEKSGSIGIVYGKNESLFCTNTIKALSHWVTVGLSFTIIVNATNSVIRKIVFFIILVAAATVTCASVFRFFF